MMRAVEDTIRLNDYVAAEELRDRFIDLRDAAIGRQRWKQAKLYDQVALDFQRFMDGKITVWPDKTNRKAKLFVPSVGRDFRPTVARV